MKIPIYHHGKTVFAIIDDCDAHLAKHRWHVTREGYVLRKEGNRTFYLHREILGLPFGDHREGDHRNRNPLDNRRCNLRIVTRAENNDNCGSKHRRRNAAKKVSAFRGVQWHEQKGKWRARYRDKHLGLFDDELKAAAVAEEARA